MRTISRIKSLALFVSLSFFVNIFAPLGVNVLHAKDNELKRTIAVLAFSPPLSGTDKKLVRSARKRVSKSKKFYIISNNDINSFSRRYFNEGDSSVRKTLDEAQDLLVRGKEQYDRLQFSESVKTLKLSIKKYKSSLSYVRDATDMIRALIYLGMAYITMNNKRNGKRYITEALRMDPERRTRQLSESLFPPNIRALYKARQDYIKKQNAGKLTIVSTPPGGTLYINGFKVGEVISQKVITDLPPGRHYIMLEKVGYSRYYEEVKLGKEDVTINAVMEKWAGFAEVDIGSINDVKREQFRTISMDLGADVLLLGSIIKMTESEYKVKVQFFDSKDGSFSKIQQETVAKLDKTPKACSKVVNDLIKKSLTNYNEVISYSYEGMAPIAMPVGDDIRDNSFEEGGGDSIFKKWWFWTIIGGAALAAGGGVLLFTDIAKSDPSHNLVKINKP